MMSFERNLKCIMLCSITLFNSFAADLDTNRDGVIRLALLSTPTHNGGIDASLICSDLELIIKASKPGKPVRVVHESVTLNKTLMGWWYHPESRSPRADLLTGQFDYIILAEHEDIIRNYPEFFFEGVRAVSQATLRKKTATLVVLLAKPVSSFRDSRVNQIADTVYRVADGCGLDVIPAAFGWNEALTRNRISGDSSIKARANAYLAAASIYCHLSNGRVPRTALETYWTTKRTTEALALSAREAIDKARVKRHYTGSFSGIVRIEPRVRKGFHIYSLTPTEDDPLRQNLLYVLDASNHDVFWKSPNDWHYAGFDRHAIPFDLVYGDMQQMNSYLDENLYTSIGKTPTNYPPSCTAVFARNPEGDASGESTLRQLEPILLAGYDFAKNNNLFFIPYQIAWARAQQADAKLTELTDGARSNDWLTYMLANMISAVCTGRYQPPTEKTKPRLFNDAHPRSYHEACARIGYDTITQLAALSAPINTLLLRTSNYHISPESVGFASLRLLDRPSREVRVFCAPNIQNVVALSKETLVFTPENFDIEQTVRILPVTNTPNLFLTFMASTQSEDKMIDGKNDSRPFLVNYNESDAGHIRLRDQLATPDNRFTLDLLAEPRPVAIICAMIHQHGRLTEEVYLTPHHFSGSRIRIYPTHDDYKTGHLNVSVSTVSDDNRFNGKTFDFIVGVSHNGMPVPTVSIASPENGTVFEGPSFVVAAAEADKSTNVRLLNIFLGHKLLGQAEGDSCRVPVEKGPPQSRLGHGEYLLWASAVSSGGVTVSSAPVTFKVNKTGDSPVGENARDR